VRDRYRLNFVVTNTLRLNIFLRVRKPFDRIYSPHTFILSNIHKLNLCYRILRIVFGKSVGGRGFEKWIAPSPSQKRTDLANMCVSTLDITRQLCFTSLKITPYRASVEIYLSRFRTRTKWFTSSSKRQFLSRIPSISTVMTSGFLPRAAEHIPRAYRSIFRTLHAVTRLCYQRPASLCLLSLLTTQVPGSCIVTSAGV